MARSPIQQRLNNNNDDIPLFCGNATINTIKPARHVKRIEQGISTVAWTQALAFFYFRNSVRNNADNWLRNFLPYYPNAELTRAKSKPLLCKCFGVSCLKNTFITKMSKLTLIKYKNNLDKYYKAINDIITAEKECYLTATIEYLEDLNFTADIKKKANLNVPS